MKNRSTKLILALAVLGSALSIRAAENSSAGGIVKKLKIAYAAKITCSNDARCRVLVDDYTAKFNPFPLLDNKQSDCQDIEQKSHKGGVPSAQAVIRGEIIVSSNDIVGGNEMPSSDEEEAKKVFSSEEAALLIKCIKENYTYKYNSSGKRCNECMEASRENTRPWAHWMIADSTKAARLCRENGMSKNAIIDIECTEIKFTPVVE